MVDWSPSLVWLLVGLGFVVSELFVPGFVLLFFGVGSWATALLLLALHPPLGAQLLFFTGASLAALFTLRRNLLSLRGKRHRESVPNSDIKGKRGVVTRAIVANGMGEIKALGSFWRATSPVDLAEGQDVTISKRDRDDPLTLHVFPCD